MLRFVLPWPILLGLYLLLSGDAGTSELIAGCAVATVATLLLARLEVIAQRRFSLPPGALRTVGTSLAGLLSDSARVAGVLLRVLAQRPDGAVGTAEDQSVPVTGDGKRDAGRRALETLAQSLSPNGFALSVREGSLRLHRLSRQ